MSKCALNFEMDGLQEQMITLSSSPVCKGHESEATVGIGSPKLGRGRLENEQRDSWHNLLCSSTYFFQKV